MTVLVAYNDSPEGAAALRAAAEESVRASVPLSVLVLTPHPQGARDGAPPPDLAHLLDLLSSRLAPAGPPHVEFRDAALDPAEAVLDAAGRTAAELVVIGSRKRSPVGKFLLGSTTQRVLLDSPVPVLVVKAAP